MYVIIKDHSKCQSIKAPQRQFRTKKTPKVEPHLVQTICKRCAALRAWPDTPVPHLHAHTCKTPKKSTHFLLIFYHRKLQMTLITNPTIRSRLTYHYTNHWQALQHYTTTRSPPGIDVSTCTELWTRRVVSHSYTGQTWGGPLWYKTDEPHELS